MSASRAAAASRPGPDEAPARVSVQRARKERMLADFAGMIDGAEAVLVAAYEGLSVAQITELRCTAKAGGVRLRVVKNTVARRALAARAEFAPLCDKLNGPLIYAAGASAPAVAKVLHDFAAQNNRLVVRGGVLNGAGLGPERTVVLAALPGREELLALLVRSLRAPVAGLAVALGALPSKLVRVLAALRDSKSSAAAG